MKHKCTIDMLKFQNLKSIVRIFPYPELDKEPIFNFYFKYFLYNSFYDLIFFFTFIKINTKSHPFIDWF